jgi:hypothetical protein
MLIRIKKGKDGGGALSCERADGTIVYQRQNPKLAGFFVRHDLTHFAVEMVLGHRKGFYGLLAAGWSFEDFGEKWDKKKYPADAEPSELIVGLFDAEHRSAAKWTAEEFNGFAREFMKQQDAKAMEDVITQDQIDGVRKKLAELLRKWAEMEMGGTLELDFHVQQAGKKMR